jgi:ribosomal protein S18 acetylase RimI-like enzyme
MDFDRVEQNLRTSFRVVAAHRHGGELRELPGVSIASAGVTFQMFNCAFLSRPVTSELEMARRIAQAGVHFQTRRLDWAYWVCDGWLEGTWRRGARRIFQHHGLRHSVDLPGMETTAVLPPKHPLPLIDVRRVSNDSTRDAFCAIGSLCFNVPLPWFREVFDNDDVWHAFEAWVGYVDEEPVSTAAVVVGGGALGVYNVATVPVYQKRGYAEAVMRHALSDAGRRHGIERTILQSTPAGMRLYQRMGFRTVTTISVYSC